MDDKQQGGLTGATGSLTPIDPDDEFVPAETREMNDPSAAKRDSASVHRRAEDSGAESETAQPPAGEPTLGGDERSEPGDEHL